MLRCSCPRRQSRKVGRWLLFHLRRRGRCLRQTLFRRSPRTAHLWLVARRGANHRARQSSRPRQSGIRQVRRPAGGLVGWSGGNRLLVPSRTHPKIKSPSSRRNPRRRIREQPRFCRRITGTMANSRTSSTSDTMTYTTLAQMFAERCLDTQSKGIRLTRRQRLSARRPRLPAGAAGFHRLALLRQSRHLRIHKRSSRSARLRQQLIGRSHLQRACRGRRHVDRPAALCGARRRKRRRRCPGKCLRRQRPDLRLQPGGKIRSARSMCPSVRSTSSLAGPIVERCSFSPTTRSSQ